MNWVAEENCVLCGSKDFKFFDLGRFPILQFKEVLQSCPLGVMTTFFICNECGLIFQSPHMDNEMLDEFYKSGIYRQMVNTLTTDPVKSLEIQDRDERIGQIAWAELVPAGGKHLDIGCSHGLMLEMTRMKGCEIMGVEPNLSYVDFGVPAVASIYEVEGQWDTITCKHVLEHVPNLTKFAAKMVELLKPGGTLMLEVPAEGANGAALRLQHIYLFRPETIRRLFSGLKELEYKKEPHHFFRFMKE